MFKSSYLISNFSLEQFEIGKPKSIIENYYKYPLSHKENIYLKGLIDFLEEKYPIMLPIDYTFTHFKNFEVFQNFYEELNPCYLKSVNHLIAEYYKEVGCIDDSMLVLCKENAFEMIKVILYNPLPLTNLQKNINEILIDFEISRLEVNQEFNNLSESSKGIIEEIINKINIKFIPYYILENNVTSKQRPKDKRDKPVNLLSFSLNNLKDALWLDLSFYINKTVRNFYCFGCGDLINNPTDKQIHQFINSPIYHPECRHEKSISRLEVIDSQ